MPLADTDSPTLRAIDPGRLGCDAFRRRHGIKYAYVAGAMYKGIASKELVVRIGRARLLGFLGTGGLKPERIDRDLQWIGEQLGGTGIYGANFLAAPFDPEIEHATAEILLERRVPRIEAAAFTQISMDLAWLRLRGMTRDADGVVRSPRQIMTKISRPEVAAQFLRPVPDVLRRTLLASGLINAEEAEWGATVPVADDICVESDSGGHTDRGVAYVLLPVILRLRDDLSREHGYARKIGVGAAGGLGTPEAVAASFVVGADFVLTGSVNQCTVEAGTSDRVKDMLQAAEAQDMDIVPAGDMFEMGAKVQVFKRGLLFPGRAKKLYDLYRQYDSIEQIDAKTREQIETRYFKRSFDAVWEETRMFYAQRAPAVIARAERDPKHRMALIFRWYFVHTSRLALAGEPAEQTDFQIHSGPALGAFNQWVRGTAMADWRNRHVDLIADQLMTGAAAVLSQRYRSLIET